MHIQTKIHRSFLLGLFCFICACGILLVCSECSPLYPYNQWGDANIYFTIGRGMTKGLMPYRDLVDHKGPLLYLLHMVGAWINSQSFLGVWLLELIAGTSFLYFSAKLLLLFAGTGWTWASVPIIAVLIYSSSAFGPGDSAEEFCLPLLAFSLYSFCRMFKAGEHWRPQLLLIWGNGILAGIILWTKFTLLGFHFGWMAVLGFIFWLKDHTFLKALKAGFVFLGGMLTITLLVFFYFLSQGALADLFEVYFYDNLFHYVPYPVHWSEPLYNMLMSGLDLLRLNPLLVGLDLIGGLGLLFCRRLFQPIGRLAFLVLLFFMGFFIWGASRGFPYYGFPFACFLPIGIAVIANLPWSSLPFSLFSFSKKWKGILLCGLWAVCIFFSYQLSPNTWYMHFRKEDLPQAKFAAIVDAADGKTLLSYRCFDNGFYTFCDITPTCKYFTHLNLSDTTEMDELVNSMVARGAFDFIVTLSPTPYSIMQPHYELVSTENWVIEGDLVTYGLYQRNFKLD